MDNSTKDPGVKQPYLIMTLVLNEPQCQKFARIVKEKDLRGGTVLRGEGTVNSATLNLLGIKSQKKEVVSLLIEKERSGELLDYLVGEFQLHEPGRGIVYTTPVATADEIVAKGRRACRESQNTEDKCMYQKLTVIVNRGGAEDVMEIARKTGVKGGTVLHGRGTGSEFDSKLFGVEIVPEKEVIIMLMPADIIEPVVNDLYRELELNAPGNGILFVEPILDVRGLFDSYKNEKNPR